MARNIKALGLALFAVFAMSAMSAGAASAEPLFHSDGSPTVLDAEGLNPQVLKTSVGEIRCSGVSVDATLEEETTDEITATPTYSGCEVEETASGSPFTAHVEFTSCDYLFTSTSEGEHAPIHVQCSEPEDEIHVKATFLGFKIQCITIPAQTPTGGGVTYSNGEGDVTIDATVTGIEYTLHSNCGGTGSPYHTTNDGTYRGEVTVTGTNEAGEPTSISVE